MSIFSCDIHIHNHLHISSLRNHCTDYSFYNPTSVFLSFTPVVVWNSSLQYNPNYRTLNQTDYNLSHSFYIWLSLIITYITFYSIQRLFLNNNLNNAHWSEKGVLHNIYNIYFLDMQENICLYLDSHRRSFRP